MKNKGYGARLLHAAEQSVVELGITTFSLESSITAQGFYEHFDYVQIDNKNELQYVKTIER